MVSNRRDNDDPLSLLLAPRPVPASVDGVGIASERVAAGEGVAVAGERELAGAVQSILLLPGEAHDVAADAAAELTAASIGSDIIASNGGAVLVQIERISIALRFGAPPSGEARHHAALRLARHDARRGRDAHLR